MAERLEFDVLARTAQAEGGLQNVGRKAAAAGDDVMALAKRLDELGRKSAMARVGLQGNKEATAQLDALDLKMARVGNKVMDPKVTVEGTAKAATELGALDVAIDKVGKSAGDAAGSGGAGGGGLGALTGGGGAAGGGMLALVVAAAALSPVILTVGTGLAGLGAAAYGVAKPIVTAAQATGGLTANMKTLNPEQQQVAKGLLNLGLQFAAFQKQMQPTVFNIFNKGIALARDLLRGVEPVAAATGKAFGGMLGAVDREFRSGTWQQFFGFMGRTAGPDVKLLSGAFVGLLDALPPLIEALQPVATALLTIVKDSTQLLDLATKFPQVFAPGITGFQQFGHAAGTAGQSVDFFSQKSSDTIQKVGVGNPVIRAFGQGMGVLGHLADGAKVALGLATGKIEGAGDTAAVSGPKFFSLNSAVKALNTSMTKLVSNLLALQGGEIAWKQALQAAEVQLKSNTAGLEGNSKNALANKAAVLAATNAAIAFATQELTTGKDIGGASRTVEAQIRFLQGLHDKSVFVRQELAALRREEALLQAQKINQTIKVQGLGSWSVTQSLAPGVGHRRATGGRVPGYGGGDTWPALLEGGEAIVPKHLTRAVAPFLKAHGVPGFAAGLVPSEHGLPGMLPWVKRDDSATIHLIDEAVVKATVAGMRAAQSAAATGGFGGHGVTPTGPLQSYARQLVGAVWPGLGEWLAFADIVARESGWNVHATNPTSGAYGIPQALPPGKMASAGADWATNGFTQLRWMVGYIRDRWIDPIRADFNERNAHWYDHGGYLPPGRSVAVNNTGQPERVSGPGSDGVTHALLRQVIAELKAAPGKNGAAVGDALNGVAARALYAGRYSSR